MSKKKASKKTRAAAARKPAKSRSSRGPKGPATRRQSGKVQLKPIIVLIERAIADLRRLPATESTELAIKQLDIARMAVDDICTRPGGCGPTMEFPPPPAA